jgi:hypothetical protein
MYTRDEKGNVYYILKKANIKWVTRIKFKLYDRYSYFEGKLRKHEIDDMVNSTESECTVTFINIGKFKNARKAMEDIIKTEFKDSGAIGWVKRGLSHCCSTKEKYND